MNNPSTTLSSHLSCGRNNYTRTEETSSGFVETLARVYEKARNALEYRADNLIRRAAIERILRRRVLLNKNPKSLSENLLTELKWAKYLSLEEIKKAKKDDLERILAKYMSHNLVQLARMSGEFDGIEATRKRRLEKEPEGFFLDDGKGPYSCGICGEGAYGKDIWWTLNGLWCRNCWNNIKAGVIPPLKHRYDNDNIYFQDWQIQDDFGVHPATRGKLVREGLLKGRDLKNENGQVYYTVYLVSENQEFLKKYPRKDKKTRETIVGKDGKQIEL